MDQPTTIKIAQALGITLSSFLSGAIISISAVSIPALIAHAPAAALAPHWHTLFVRGSQRAPPLAILSALSFLYVAWNAAASSTRSVTGADDSWLTVRTLSGTAAVATLAIIPYTLVLMAAVNGRLSATAGVAGASGPVMGVEETKEAVEAWGGFNLVRGLFPLVGAGLGAFSVMFL